MVELYAGLTYNKNNLFVLPSKFSFLLQCLLKALDRNLSLYSQHCSKPNYLERAVGLFQKKVEENRGIISRLSGFGGKGRSWGWWWLGQQQWHLHSCVPSKLAFGAHALLAHT